MQVGITAAALGGDHRSRASAGAPGARDRLGFHRRAVQLGVPRRPRAAAARHPVSRRRLQLPPAPQMVRGPFARLDPGAPHSRICRSAGVKTARRGNFTDD